MNRTHWAVKDGDLLAALRATGVTTSPEPATRAGEDITAALSRQTLLNACEILQVLGHTPFDKFLLELGVEGLNAGRDRGGLAARAAAVGHFVVQNRGARTVEGEPMELAMVRKAAELDPEYPDGVLHNVAPRTRAAFWKGLARDGFEVRDGEIVRVAAAGDASGQGPRGARTNPPVALPNQPGARAPQVPAPTHNSAPPRTKKVFLVHGRDDGAKYEVAHYLLRLGLDPVILHEQPNGGRTLITKFREESADVGFAVILMTPDDVGGLKDKAGAPRARQNVVFELGYFVGKLGPERVCALIARGIERPSDFEGVVYVPFGSDTPWRNDLARELHAAGIPFDPTKVF